MKGRADDAGPQDHMPAPSKVVEAVLGLLEEAGVPSEVNDKIVRLIEEWEFSQQPHEHDSPEANWLEGIESGNLPGGCLLTSYSVYNGRLEHGSSSP